MTKPLETAPELPAGSVDFNQYVSLVAKGDADAAAKADITPVVKDDPAPAAKAADKPAT